MVGGDGENAAACSRPPRASAAAKGKGTGAALSGGTTPAGTSKGKGTMAAGRSTKDDSVEVVCPDGTRVKLTGPIQCIWSHGTKYKVVGFTYGYCHQSFSGGGATRFKEHLGAISGSVAACEKVPRNVKTLMANLVAERRIRSKKNRNLRLYVEKEILEANGGYRMPSWAGIPNDEEAQFQMAVRESLITCGIGPVNSSSHHQSTLDKFFQSPQCLPKGPFDIDLARSKAPVQSRVDVMLADGAKEKIGKAWAKWFHANDIPGRKADCPYFREGAGGVGGTSERVAGDSGGEETKHAGATGAQLAPSPLRPRSKRLKKKPVKCLY